MCIYYTTRDDLTYTSGEHIIPAGLGGIKKLSDNMVSAEFNNDISKYESWLLKDSILNAIRQVIGPGSRGKLGPKHESKSHVHILEGFPNAADLMVGYIKKGHPMLVPSIMFDSSNTSFKYNMGNTPGLDVGAAIESFARALDKPYALKIKTITDDRLPPRRSF